MSKEIAERAAEVLKAIGRTPVNEQEGRAQVQAIILAAIEEAQAWRPIETAEHVSGLEFEGIRCFGGKIVKEMFISFWSPTLGKFYCEPTHWRPLPPPPKEQT